MKVSFAPGDTFLRTFAGSAIRPLLSTEYEYRPLNEDINPSLQKCLILLEKNHPRFPTFPHTAWKFRELAIKVKYKSAEKSRVFG
jgi:hypothetical protein